MHKTKEYDYLLTWVESLRANGRLSFSLEEARSAFDVSQEALKSALMRLSKQGVIKSLVRGFYLYLPPEYRKGGMLPASLFIDDLMQFLQHRYYLGLLSAASIHGASHQAPQQVFVVTELPTLRPVKNEKLFIRFVHTRDFPEMGMEQKKTQTGYLQVSSPELTALDLVKFEKQVGGLQRTTEVLEELQETIDPKKLQEIARQYPSTATLQRLGYIFECILENEEVASTLDLALESRLRHYLLLSTVEGDETTAINSKWKIKVNTELTAEF